MLVILLDSVMVVDFGWRNKRRTACIGCLNGLLLINRDRQRNLFFDEYVYARYRFALDVFS